MSLQVNNNIQTQAAGLNDSFASLEKTGSVQFLFALLQLELSQTNKTAAMEKINSIRDSQTDSKTYTDAINALRTMSDYDVEKYGELPTDLETIQQEIKTATAALEDLEQYADGDKPYYDEKNKTWATKQESTDYWYKNEYIKAGEASAFDALRVGGEEDHNLSEIEAGIEAVSTRLEALKAYETLLTSTSVSGTSILSDSKISLSGNPTADDIKNWISNLESSQEELGTDIQQQIAAVVTVAGKHLRHLAGRSRLPLPHARVLGLAPLRRGMRLRVPLLRDGAL